MLLLVFFAAVRHSDSVNDSAAACARLKCTTADGKDSTAGQAAAAACSENNDLLAPSPCEAIVVNQLHSDNDNVVMNSTDSRLFSAVVSVSSPLISHSHVSLCPPPNRTSLIGDITCPAESDFLISERLSAAAGCISRTNPLAVSESSVLHTLSLPPCDRVLAENSASNNVPLPTCTATETRTSSLLTDHSVVDAIPSQLVDDDTYVKQSSLANDLHSLAVDGVNVTLSSSLGLRNCDYVLLSEQLPPEISRIHNAEVEEVSPPCSVVKKHPSPSPSPPVIECSAMSVAERILPNVTVSTGSTSPTQNGLSVGHIVSHLKSMTAMAAAKSQKTARLKSKLHV